MNSKIKIFQFERIELLMDFDIFEALIATDRPYKRPLTIKTDWISDQGIFHS